MLPQRFDVQWPSSEAVPALDKPTLFIESLVGGIPTPLKNMKVSWDYYSHLFPIYGNIKNNPNHQPDKIPIFVSVDH